MADFQIETRIEFSKGVYLLKAYSHNYPYITLQNEIYAKYYSPDNNLYQS